MLPTTIIVPLDGSSLAEAALEPGSELARSFDADLLLVRACWHRPPDREELYLAKVVATLGDVRARTRTVHGAAAQAVAAVVEDTPGSMLCLSTRGHTGLVGEVLLGSVAAELIEGSSAPILAIGPSYAGSRLPGNAPSPIIYCFDGSVAARSLERTVIAWADQLRLPIDVVTVLHRDGEFLGDAPADATRSAAEKLVDHLSERGFDSRHRVINSIDPARAILLVAEESNAALIVAGTTAAPSSRGMARLTRTVLGGTAERLLRHSPTPVLIARPEPCV